MRRDAGCPSCIMVTQAPSDLRATLQSGCLLVEPRYLLTAAYDIRVLDSCQDQGRDCPDEPSAWLLPSRARSVLWRPIGTTCSCGSCRTKPSTCSRWYASPATSPTVQRIASHFWRAASYVQPKFASYIRRLAQCYEARGKANCRRATLPYSTHLCRSAVSNLSLLIAELPQGNITLPYKKHPSLAVRQAPNAE